MWVLHVNKLFLFILGVQVKYVNRSKTNNLSNLSTNTLQENYFSISLYVVVVTFWLHLPIKTSITSLGIK